MDIPQHWRHTAMLTISQFFYMIYYGMPLQQCISYFNGQRDYEPATSANACFTFYTIDCGCISIPVFLCRNEIDFIFTDSDNVCLLVAIMYHPVYRISVRRRFIMYFCERPCGMSDVKLHSCISHFWYISSSQYLWVICLVSF